MSKLSHIDDQGRASMVDVSDKDATERLATAEAIILLSAEAYRLVVTGTAKKGDVLATARIAGIMAAKKTSELIPLCHPLALSHVGVDFDPLAGTERVPDCREREDDRSDRRRDGGADGRLRRRLDRVRHGQGRGQRRGHRLHPSTDEIGRQERQLRGRNAVCP